MNFLLLAHLNQPFGKWYLLHFIPWIHLRGWYTVAFFLKLHDLISFGFVVELIKVLFLFFFFYPLFWKFRSFFFWSQGDTVCIYLDFLHFWSSWGDYKTMLACWQMSKLKWQCKRQPFSKPEVRMGWKTWLEHCLGVNSINGRKFSRIRSTTAIYLKPRIRTHESRYEFYTKVIEKSCSKSLSLTLTQKISWNLFRSQKTVFRSSSNYL